MKRQKRILILLSSLLLVFPLAGCQLSRTGLSDSSSSVSAASLSLSSASLSLGIGEKKIVAVQIEGYLGTPAYQVSSSDPAVASAQINGAELTVTGLSQGKCAITVQASLPDGLVSAQCEAEVTKGLDLSLAVSQLFLEAGDQNIPVFISTPGISGAVFASSSSTGQIASGKIEGDYLLVSALQAGTAVIEVKGQAGNATGSASLQVSVVSSSSSSSALGNYIFFDAEQSASATSILNSDSFFVFGTSGAAADAYGHYFAGPLKNSSLGFLASAKSLESGNSNTGGEPFYSHEAGDSVLPFTLKATGDSEGSFAIQDTSTHCYLSSHGEGELSETPDCTAAEAKWLFTYNVTSDYSGWELTCKAKSTLGVEGVTKGKQTVLCFSVDTESKAYFLSAHIEPYLQRGGLYRPVQLFTLKRPAVSARTLTLAQQATTIVSHGGAVLIKADAAGFGADLALTAVSDSTDICTAEVKNGSILLTAGNPGTAKITVTAADAVAAVSQTISVTVVDKTLTASLSESSLELAENSSGSVPVTFAGFEATPSCQVTSSDSSIASGTYSDGKILVSSYSSGSCTLTLTASGTEGSCSVALQVTVVASGTTAAYRITPVSSSGTSASIYQVVKSGSGYQGTAVKTIYKDSIYTDHAEVAFYYQAFKAYPKNYAYYTKATLDEVKASSYGTYGTSARLWTSYSGNYGYTQYFPTLNTYTYIEADIAVDSGYASSSTWNRGTGRLVIVPSGAACYNSGSMSYPAIFKTLDHYASFCEFYNRYDASSSAFGALFDGEGSNGYGSWVQPLTVSYHV